MEKQDQEINSNRAIIEKLQKELEEKQNEIMDNEAYLNSDEYLQDFFNKNSIANSIVSKVYKGRIVNIVHTNNNEILISQYNRNLHLQQGTNYKPLDIRLTEESFILLLEAMLFSVKKFNIKKEPIIEKLTEGKVSKTIDFDEMIPVLKYLF